LKRWPVEQAVDGEQAVDVFRNITAACIGEFFLPAPFVKKTLCQENKLTGSLIDWIVLLDINMYV
jgi:hypothetical protein